MLSCELWMFMKENPDRTKNETLALRQVNLEPTANWGTNSTRALVRLCWSSQSLPKKIFRQIFCKSTLVEPIKSSQIWKETNQIPKVHVFQQIKTNSPKTTNPIYAHDTVFISEVTTTKYKTKSHPLPNQTAMQCAKSFSLHQVHPNFDNKRVYILSVVIGS